MRERRSPFSRGWLQGRSRGTDRRCRRSEITHRARAPRQRVHRIRQPLRCRSHRADRLQLWLPRDGRLRRSAYVGNRLPYTQFFPKHAKVIQIDIRGNQIGRRTKVDLGLVGSVKDSLSALLLCSMRRPIAATWTHRSKTTKRCAKASRSWLGRIKTRLPSIRNTWRGLSTSLPMTMPSLPAMLVHLLCGPRVI